MRPGERWLDCWIKSEIVGWKGIEPQGPGTRCLIRWYRLTQSIQNPALKKIHMFLSTIKKSFPPRIQLHSQQQKKHHFQTTHVCRTPASAEPNANSSGAKSEPRNCASPFPFLGNGTFEVTRQDEGNTTVVAIFVWLGIYDILLF